jgi:single-strand DNA-binding protein
MNLNIAFILGNVSTEPEVKYLPSGMLVCNLRVATNSFKTNKTTNQKEQKTEFHNIILFGKLAEIAQKYLHKGSLALFSGRLSTREWTDKNELKHYRTEIIAKNLQLGPKMNKEEEIETF